MQEDLLDLKKHALYRRLNTINAPQLPRTIINNTDCLLFSSNNYLGLTEHPAVKKAAEEAIKYWGTGAGGSRMTTGNLKLHEELESTIACFKNTEAAIVFNTGYMANLGIITALVGKGDLILSDELNHASIIDGCRLSKAQTRIFPHKDIAFLEKTLIKSCGYRRRLIVTDGVFSMDGDLAPLPQLAGLAQKYKAVLMVDDAHATGVLGSRGAGTADHFGLKDKIHIQMGTLSKAVGSAGAYAAGSHALIDYLRNKARSFIFSTALPPAVLAAAKTALEIIQKCPDIRESLHFNARYLRSGLKKMGFSILGEDSPIIPVFTGDAHKTIQMAEKLLSYGIFAPGIRPPTVPPGGGRIRVTVMATHTQKELDTALSAFARSGRDLNII